MDYSRRRFLKAVGGTAALAPLSVAAATTSGAVVTPDQIIDLFEPLPGRKALKIFAPAAGGKPEFVAELNAGERLFAASANKTYALCEALRPAFMLVLWPAPSPLENTGSTLPSS
jgi:beta-lactamase class A